MKVVGCVGVLGVFLFTKTSRLLLTWHYGKNISAKLTQSRMFLYENCIAHTECAKVMGR